MSEDWYEFSCPECGSKPLKCGQGECKSKEYFPYINRCQGINCRCGEILQSTFDHGNIESDPCKRAMCYHCGFEGLIPQIYKSFEDEAFQKHEDWKQKALKAGWTPPK